MIDQVEKGQKSLEQLDDKLLKMRNAIGDADVAALLKQRDKEVGEFSTKLRKVEIDFQDVKKKLKGSQNQEAHSIENDMV